MTTHIHYSRWFKKEPTVHTRTAWHVFLVLVEFKTVVRLASLRFLIIEFLFFSSWILLSAAKAHISQRSQKKKKKRNRFASWHLVSIEAHAGHRTSRGASTFSRDFSLSCLESYTNGRKLRTVGRESTSTRASACLCVCGEENKGT